MHGLPCILTPPWLQVQSGHLPDGDFSSLDVALGNFSKAAKSAAGAAFRDTKGSKGSGCGKIMEVGGRLDGEPISPTPP